MIELESDPTLPEADSRSSLVVVSNRLPVTRVRRKQGTEWESSPGGLVSALRPILRDRQCSWIGWPGVTSSVAPFQFDGMLNVPVSLNVDEVHSFYAGFCNRVLWPLFHDAIRKPEYRRDWWRDYQRINMRYAEQAAATAAHGAVVWVHDYHLHLVPAMLRAMRPDVRIGFFLHIPFPPQELFAQLPWRGEILQGMLGSDIVGFQTQVGAENFAQVCRRFADARGDDDQIEFSGRSVRVGCFPISIDYERYHTLAASDEVAERRKELRTQLGPSRRILLGVDRLDYTKGIDIRLQAFRELLSKHEEVRDHCVLVQVAVPSREVVTEYRELRRRVQSLVGEINGEFSEIGRTPVQYLHRGIDAVELSALYSAADVMLVTPLRDGMNLVCKEFVASRTEDTGALVLSEFTGAAKELSSAMLVNPHDIDGLVRSMHTALRMPVDEQARRMRHMRRAVREHNVFDWAHGFFEALEHAHAA